MKIVSLSSSFPSPVHPTAGIFVLHRLAAVARLGADIEVVHPMATCPLIGRLRDRGPVPAREVRGGLTVHHRPFAYLPGLLKRLDGHSYYRGLVRWMEAYCRRRRIDLLDAHFAWPDGVGASYLARRLGLPYVLTLRGTINSRAGLPAFRARLADAVRRADAVISVSGPMADLAVELGARAERVGVIANGVDAETFKPIPRDEARRRLGLAADGPLIVCVASAKPQKGHEDLIAALARLQAAARVVLVGGPSGSGRYERRLAGQARVRGLADRVVFAGRQDPSRVADYLNAADVSVLASHSEGCPNVVLESLACGTPVVATAVGAVPDLLRAGQTGLIVPPRDPAALAEALDGALTADWSREAIRASVQDRSWAAVGERVLAVFHEVLDGRTRQDG